MTFEEWIAQQPLELVAGSGRYEDMRMAFRAGQDGRTGQALDSIDKCRRGILKSPGVGLERQEYALACLEEVHDDLTALPLEGDDE